MAEKNVRGFDPRLLDRKKYRTVYDTGVFTIEEETIDRVLREDGVSGDKENFAEDPGKNRF